MKHKKLKLGFVFLSGLMFTGLYAQESINAGGAEASGTGGTAHYSVGQVTYSTFSGTGGSMAEGVQLPYTIEVVNSVDEAAEIDLSYLVKPNPTTDYLSLVVKNYEVEALSYQLYNINGSLLIHNSITDQNTRIDMADFSPGTYLLKITNRNEAMKTFEVVKY